MSAFDESLLDAFSSDVVDRVLSGPTPGVWSLPGGSLVLPQVFGFCRGVKRALAMAAKAVADHAGQSGKLILLGEIIHNPWVNDYFQQRGVIILEPSQRDELSRHITGEDVAIIPAFGAPPKIQQCLKTIGCQVIDCSCGDVIRLWRWSGQEAAEGFAVLIFGRPTHDETVVTKERLAEAGGRYLVVKNLNELQRFIDLLEAGDDAASLLEYFSPEATNAASLTPFLKLAQVSQTTMLYSDTQEVRRRLTEAFIRRFGRAEEDTLRFQPTVCRATQNRQNAAVALCQSGCDLIIVVGGFGSSNTRHLHDLAGQFAPAYLIEDARSILSARTIAAYDHAAGDVRNIEGYLPEKRPLKIGVLAGASSPEIVIGEVLQRLAEFLG